jgi:hypothetical protein
MIMPPIGTITCSNSPTKCPSPINKKPKTRITIGNVFRCFAYALKSANEASAKERAIIKSSIQHSARKLRPHKGSKVANIGTIAQCRAHRIEADIPALSTSSGLGRNFIRKYKRNFVAFANVYIVYLVIIN